MRFKNKFVLVTGAGQNTGLGFAAAFAREGATVFLNDRTAVPDEFAEKAKLAVKAGFRELKWDPFGSAYLEIDKRVPIAAQAEANHLAICPHNPSGPVANAASLQLAACVPNFSVLETMSADVPHRREISTERVTFENGAMQIPDAPGLGIDLNIEAMAAHPYDPRDPRHYNGQLTNIRPPDATGYFEKHAKRKSK